MQKGGRPFYDPKHPARIPLPGERKEAPAAAPVAAAPPVEEADRKPSPLGESGGPRVETASPDIEQAQKLREDLERPIKMNIEAPDIPSQLVPQFRRASARAETNREFREARWSSYSDIGAA